MEKTLLVPLDKSEITKELVRISDEWADHAQASLIFLHVGTKQGREADEALRLFQEFLKDMKVQRPYQAIYRRGNSYVEILKTMEEKKPSLIIMGGHSHSTVGRLFLGSNTDHVVHKSKCPVYVYKQQKIFFEKNIIVPLDFTEINRPVALLADEWAQRTGAEIYFVRVGTPPEMSNFFGSEAGFLQDYQHEVKQEQNRIQQANEFQQELVLKRYVKELGIKAKYQWIYCSGKPYERILEFQKSYNARLIMMAAHSHTMLDRFLTGSNTDYLLHHATCPIYVHKPVQY